MFDDGTLLQHINHQKLPVGNKFLVPGRGSVFVNH